MPTLEELPRPVADAIEQGVHLIRAYREHVGYTVEHLSIASGLTADEITRMEMGYGSAPGHLSRVSRALTQSDQLLNEMPSLGLGAGAVQ